MRTPINQRLAMLERLQRRTIPDKSKLNPDRLARIADCLVSGELITASELKPMLGAAYDG